MARIRDEPRRGYMAEVRRQREETILDVTADHLLRDGYLGLNLKRVAEEVGCSNGTLFNHFPTKEDVLLALTVRTMLIREDLFRRAAAFEGRTRERLAAVGVADRHFVRTYPVHFRVEALVKSQSMWERATPEHRARLEQHERQCHRVVVGVIEEAVAAGDLVLGDRTPAEVMLGFWSMALGVHTLVAAAEPLGDAGITDPYDALRRNHHALADGLGWRPLADEWDYDRTYQRIAEEVFPDAS